MDETGPQQGRWDPVDARMARFSGLVGEIEDPLMWGLDLEEETVTGHDDARDPTCERFLRAYRTFAGESVEVETLRVPADEDVVEDVVRAAASGALAAPLHADIAAPVEPDGDGISRPAPDFADEYQDYRSAMRAIVAEVDQVPLEVARFAVDGVPSACSRVTVRDVSAVYVPTGDRALVITGPADLVDRVDVVTRPIRPQLQDDRDGSRR
jgi:hypothetical protein